MRLVHLLTMTMLFGVVLACAGAQAAEKESGGILVWRLEKKQGVTDQEIDSISGFITSEVERNSGRKVISEADINTILKGEEKKQQCGAENSSCIAEIGAALGVPEAVSGDLGRVGEFWFLNLRRLNVRQAEVIKRSSRNVRGDINALIETIPGAVAELFGKEAPPPVAVVPVEKPKPETKPAPKPEPPKEPGVLNIASEPGGAEVWIDGEAKGKTPYKDKLAAGEHRVEVKLDGYKTTGQAVTVKPKETANLSLTLERDYPMNPYKKYGYVSFFTGVGLMAFGGIATWQAKEAADDYKAGDWGAADRNKGWKAGMGVGFGLGGAAMVAGIVLWALSPGDEVWWKEHSVSAGPASDGQGAVVMFGGRW